MADLFLNWGALGPFGTNLTSGVATSVDTGGVAVDVTFTALDPFAESFTFNADGYSPEPELGDNSFLKLFDDNNDDGAPSTASAVLDFRSTDTALYTDNVQNVVFRINDIDMLGAGGGDLGEINTAGFEDIVQVLAFDAAGNAVPVTLSTVPGGPAIAGDTATGTTATDFTDATGSVLVNIAGPVSRIEIVYSNGATAQQGVTISDVAFTTVDVGDENLPPVAVNDTASTPEDTAVVIDVLSNDSDPEGGALTVTGATATNGSVVVNADGTLTYTPNTDYVGPDTITYTIADPEGNTATGEVAVTVDPVTGNPPDAVDDTATAVSGVMTPIDVLANDSEPDGEDFFVIGVATPANGTATIGAGGVIEYTPNAGFVGTETFTYTVADDSGLTDTATITVTVSAPGGGNLPPNAVDDTATAVSGVMTPIDVLANDSEPDGEDFFVIGVATPANGTATIGAGGVIEYTPNAGFVGTETFTYTVADDSGLTDTATITVTVGPAPADNRAPVAVDDTATTGVGTPVTVDVLTNDSDPDGDTILLDPDSVTATNGTVVVNGNGTITFTPDPGFTGPAIVSYTISDGDLTDTGTLTVTVSDGGDDSGRIDTDVFPVAPGDQPRDPLDGLDQDPDPSDDLDTVVGTAGADSISTGDDADSIEGGGGNDTLDGGIDNDTIRGGDGNDLITDPQGADRVFGGDGNDTILVGIDTFSDYVGDDPAFAPGTLLNDLGFTSDPNQEDGRDYVEGNLGNDSIMTGDDRDTIDGGGGDDTVDGGIDDDMIMGGQGNDSLIGGHGSDTIDGGQGDDFIDGSNIAVLEIVDALDPVPTNDRDSLVGALGNDTILGGDDDDTLVGGSGNDLLDGGIDDDLLFGGGDADTLIGGQGNDTLDGGAGADSISGGADRDVINVEGPAQGIGDTIDGGAAGDDFDILNLNGFGVRGQDWRLVNVTEDSNGNGIDGTVEILNGAREVTGSFDFFEIEQVVPCFTPGTLIATPQGERLVEELKVGDRVITRDNGIQEIRWVGRKDLTGFDLARKPHMKPILIQKGALGNALPEHDMLVSPNHRILVANDKTALYFEEREVLVAAKHLTGLDGVDEVEANGVAYIHVMFDQHEVILSNGAWTESFQPGDYTLKGIGNAQRQEILELFPELEHAEGLKAYGSARRSLKKHEAALLTK